MTLTAWGLLLNAVGAVLIAGASFGRETAGGIQKWVSETEWEWVRKSSYWGGWTVMLLGFALQLCAEV